jgi:hypothetical protein
MSSQVTRNGEELELLRLARMLCRSEVLELLRTMSMKSLSVEKLISIEKVEKK